MGQRVVLMIVLLLIIVGGITVSLSRKQFTSAERLNVASQSEEVRNISNSIAEEAISDLQGYLQGLTDLSSFGYYYSSGEPVLSQDDISQFNTTHNNASYAIYVKDFTEELHGGDVINSVIFEIVAKAKINHNDGKVYETTTIVDYQAESLSWEYFRDVAYNPQTDSLNTLGPGMILVELRPSTNTVRFIRKSDSEEWQESGYYFPNQPGYEIVYITDTGIKYHRGDCRYLAKSKIETTVFEALRTGYTPCSVCIPVQYTDLHNADGNLFIREFTETSLGQHSNKGVVYVNGDIRLKGTVDFPMRLFVDGNVWLDSDVNYTRWQRLSSTHPKNGDKGYTNGNQARRGQTPASNPTTFPSAYPGEQGYNKTATWPANPTLAMQSVTNATYGVEVPPRENLRIYATGKILISCNVCDNMVDIYDIWINAYLNTKGQKIGQEEMAENTPEFPNRKECVNDKGHENEDMAKGVVAGFGGIRNTDPDNFNDFSSWVGSGGSKFIEEIINWKEEYVVVNE